MHQIKIAVLVGDNGDFAVGRFEDEKTDWAFLYDSIGRYNEAAGEIDYPKSDQRYVVTAVVELPRVKEVVCESASKLDA